jgi:hypothetical protein
MAEEPKTKSLEAPAPPPAPPSYATDATDLATVYTNFCRVSVTTEELVLDFGLNPRMVPDPAEPIKLSTRVVMNFYTAKRLMNTLLQMINQYENTYGALELEPQRRLRGLRPMPGGSR